MRRFLSVLLTLSWLCGCGVSSQVQPAGSKSSTTTSAHTSTKQTPKRVRATLVLKEATVYGSPQTELILKMSGGLNQVVGLGTTKAPCEIKTAQAGELIRIDCWWAGAGNRFAVKYVNGVLFVTKSQQSEHGKPEAAHVLKKWKLKPGQQVSAKLSKR